jgi:hypothetical protein
MKKPKKHTTREEDAGKYLLDLSKLIIGSVVIGGILRREIPQDIILIGGVVAAIVLFIFGLNMTTKEIKTDKTGRRKLAKPKRRKR